MVTKVKGHADGDEPIQLGIITPEARAHNSDADTLAAIGRGTLGGQPPAIQPYFDLLDSRSHIYNTVITQFVTMVAHIMRSAIQQLSHLSTLPGRAPHIN